MECEHEDMRIWKKEKWHGMTVENKTIKSQNKCYTKDRKKILYEKQFWWHN